MRSRKPTLLGWVILLTPVWFGIGVFASYLGTR